MSFHIALLLYPILARSEFWSAKLSPLADAEIIVGQVCSFYSVELHAHASAHSIYIFWNYNGFLRNIYGKHNVLSTHNNRIFPSGYLIHITARIAKIARIAEEARIAKETLCNRYNADSRVFVEEFDDILGRNRFLGVATTVMMWPCVTGVWTRMPVASTCGMIVMRSRA